MRTIETTYSDPQCQGKDCIFYGGDTKEVKYYPPGVDYWGRKHDEFESIFYGHKCSKNYEIGKIREEIYSRAQKASDNIYNTGGHKINFLIKKAGQVFDEIADEYRNMKCPFYKKVLTNENQ
jgi:hypothetical protein